MKVNYITEINRFYDWLETNQVPKSAIALWHGLMHINNKTGWDKVFTVAISTIESKTGFKRSELFEARNILTQKGRINWRQRGGNLCAEYEIFFFSVHNTDTSADTSADASADAKAYSSRTQKPTINRRDLNKSKLNKSKSHSADAAIEKVTLPFWKAFIDCWHQWYQEQFQTPYLYMKKDFAHLKGIYQFLQKRSEIKKFAFTEESLLAAFKFFLKAGWEKDNWLKQNFSLQNLLTQFNQISNGQSIAKDAKQRTGGEVSDIDLATKIARHYSTAG